MAPITRAGRKKFKFSSLPTELRLMVWKESVEPRILHITAETITLPRPATRQSTGGSWFWILNHTHVRFKAREPPPIALQICHESRTVALKHYTLAFHSTTSPLARAREMNQTAIYFNPELDIVHIVDALGSGIHTLFQRTDQETVQSIRALAVALPGSTVHPEFTRYVSKHLLALEGLETFILVIAGDAESTRSNMEDALFKTKDLLRSERKWEEWKVPVVKVMNSEAFESHL
jgi:hypothetical protein